MADVRTPQGTAGLRVKLSRKKLRRIRARAGGRQPADVAREMGLPLEAVEEALAGAAGEGGAGRVRAAEALARALPWMVALLAGLAPFAVIPRGQSNPYLLPQSVFVTTGALAALVVRLVAGALRGSVRLKRGPLDLPLLAFLGWASVSLLWAHNRHEGADRLVLWAACGAACFLAAGTLGRPDARRRLMVALAASGAAAAAVGLFQYYLGIEWFPQVVPPASTFGNKNLAAQYMVLTLPACAALFLAEGRPRAYWPLAGALVLVSALAFHAFSKAGWLAAAVAVALFGALAATAGLRGAARPAWSRGKAAASLAAASLLVLAMNTGPGGFEFRIGKAFSALADVAADAAGGRPALREEVGGDGAAATDGDERGEAEAEKPGGTAGGLEATPSLGIRLDLWRNTLGMVRDHPVLGVGVGNFRVRFPPYSNRPRPVKIFGPSLMPKRAHNDYLQVLAELGVVGLGLAAWLLVAAARTAAGAVRAGGGPGDRYAIFAAVAGAAGLLVTAVFSFPLETSVAPLVFMVLLGLVGAARAGASGEGGKREIGLPRPAAQAVAGAAFVLLLLAAWHGYHRIAGDRHHERARRSSVCDEVLAEAAETLRHDPGLSEAHLFAARAYLAKRDPRRAIDSLKKLLEAEPHSMAAMTNLSAAYARAGDHEKAVGCALRVLEMKPDSANALSNLGYHYLNLQRPREAEEAFEKAVLSEPDHAPAHFGLGRVALAAGRADEALSEFRAASRLRPDVGNYRQMQGRAALRKGDIREAVEELRAAARLMPRDGGVLYWLGRALAEGDDPAAAVGPLERAIALSPADAEYRHRLGYALFRAKRYPEARDAFLKAVDLRPGWALAHKSLGTVLYTYLGAQEEGIGHYRKALELDPQIADAAKMREIARLWDASRGRLRPP